MYLSSLFPLLSSNTRSTWLSAELNVVRDNIKGTDKIALMVGIDDLTWTGEMAVNMERSGWVREIFKDFNT